MQLPSEEGWPHVNTTLEMLFFRSENELVHFVFV